MSTEPALDHEVHQGDEDRSVSSITERRSTSEDADPHARHTVTNPTIHRSTALLSTPLATVRLLPLDTTALSSDTEESPS